MKNTLKEKLEQGKAVFGSFVVTNGLDNAEIMAHTGADCLMIDGEHGSMDLETAGKMISVIRNTKTTPLLRVANNDIALVKRGLDTGAHGLMIPLINTREEAEKAVQYSKYPPVGVRGMGLGRAVLFGAKADEYTDYFAKANDEVLLIVQVEHYTAVENIDEILSVPGIDIAFVGPMDLSTSMGISGQLDHPDVIKNCEKVIEACRKHNVVPGTMTWAGAMKKHMDMGFKFLLGGIDGIILYNGMRQLVDEFSKEA
ncbi:MAG: aldolase/citrate lyase family protein [Sedimentibacter sp.]|uniref:HpcH/HpaI aldolase family protein n=1 Tax=Sedimentibacter sp. TaxID=1960295 RepID=UPI0031584198